jgi:flavocytochrome c
MSLRTVCRPWFVFCSCLLAAAVAHAGDQAVDSPDADVIIVGAGLAGLSAAIDAANGGASVLVVDMNSVFGGHGIQSGGVCVVGSPMQEAMGFHDTPDQAYKDWMEWTVDGDPAWTRFYVDHSRTMIYDWITAMGVRFDRVIPGHGNSVPRFHMTYRRGFNLLRPLYLEALRYPNIAFRWNALAEHLIEQRGRISGVQILDYRPGRKVELHARAVILATGGFESNIEMVKANWPADLPVPDEIYSMSGQNSRGSGLRMAQEVGAALVRMDHQYNGYAALPNVLGLDQERGFVAGNAKSIWVNKEGKRFVTETGVDRDVFPVVMRQQPWGHWLIFDDDGKDGFRINSPHFVSAQAVDVDKIRRLVVDNPQVTAKADTLQELAARIGVPAEALAETVRRYNEQVESGASTDVDGMPAESPPPVFTIAKSPFYATRAYPMSNKSAGGIAIDMGTRALDAKSQPVAGLYAAGEVNGSAGINGLHGLDGMFTGPAILTGRVAGRTAVADLAAGGTWTAAPVERSADLALAPAAPDPSWDPAMGATEIKAMLAHPRDGYWHFERVHSMVLERDYACTQCHSSLLPFAPATSMQQKLAQVETCGVCHLAPTGVLDPTSSERPGKKAD